MSDQSSKGKSKSTTVKSEPSVKSRKQDPAGRWTTNYSDDPQDKTEKRKKTPPTGKGSAGGWIAFVKEYQQTHGCSYKDALKGASLLWKK
jgi:hypothetical protein